MYMQAPDDKILQEIYDDFRGLLHTESYFNFFKQLKEKYPETILYGTGLGLSHFSTGKRYLDYLKENGLENSIKYELTAQCMQQGKEALGKFRSAFAFKRQKGLENFIAAKKRAGISRAICCIQHYNIEPGDINLYEKPLNAPQQQLEKVYEKWSNYYKEGHRILFEDVPYYVAEFLNMYMQAPDDKILYEVLDDIKGRLLDVKGALWWMKKVKEDFPETVFYGTDIGWGDAAGTRYLKYLKDKGLEDSIHYKLASECIAQKKECEDVFISVVGFCQQNMAENFIDAYKRAGVSEVVGIYENSYINSTEDGSIVDQVKKHYGDIVEGIYIKDLLQKDKRE